MEGAAPGTCSHRPGRTLPQQDSALALCSSLGVWSGTHLPGHCPLNDHGVGRWAPGDLGDTCAPHTQPLSLSGPSPCAWETTSLGSGSLGPPAATCSLALPWSGSDPERQWGICGGVSGGGPRCCLSRCFLVNSLTSVPRSLPSPRLPMQMGFPAAWPEGWSQIFVPALCGGGEGAGAPWSDTLAAPPPEQACRLAPHPHTPGFHLPGGSPTTLKSLSHLTQIPPQAADQTLVFSCIPRVQTCLEQDRAGPAPAGRGSLRT